MANTKEYKIVINGVEQSIDAVKALNAQLEALDAKIKELESRKININAVAPTVNVNTTTTTSSSRGNASALSEEAAIQKEINKLKAEGATLDAKIAAAQDEVYRKVDATKQLYKETIADQKALAAQDRLTADAYATNTLQGMKDKLSDLKKVINTTDLGDSDKIKDMVQAANELNNKLKDIEQSYGQFGRNVGNYANGVAEGLQKIGIEVGGTVREFSSAREASKTLSNELKTMAVNGKQDTEEFKELQKVVARLNSDIKDATVSSKGMDTMLDTMQGIVAVASTAKGLGAIFGMDNDKIDESIQKLVALQNVMKGIEEIRQQMNTGEGIGGLFAKGNEAVDKLAASILGANKAQQALNTSTTAGKTASQGLAAAETAQATATAGATTATKALSMALKAIGIGLVITAVSTLITYWEDIYNWFTDTVPVLKNLEKWFGKIRAAVSGVGTAIANYLIQPIATVGKVVKALIEGNFSDIPKIISEGLKKQFDVVGNFQKGFNKESERQQEVHNEKMRQEQLKANEEAEKDAQAKYGADLARQKEFYKKQMSLVKEGSDEYKEFQRKYWETERQEKEANDRKKAEANKKALAEEKKQFEEAQRALNALQMRLMDDGLNKKLMQLDEEKRQTLNKLNQNSQAYLEVEKMYEHLRLREIQNYVKELEKSIEESKNRISSQSLSINVSKINEELKTIKQDLEGTLEFKKPLSTTLISEDDYNEIVRYSKLTKEELESIINEFNKLQAESSILAFNINSEDDKKRFGEVTKRIGELEQQYARQIALARSYNLSEQKTLEDSFKVRYEEERDFHNRTYAEAKRYFDKKEELLRKQADKELEIANNAASGAYETQKEELNVKVRKLKNDIRGLETNKNITEEDEETLEKLKNSYVKYTEQYKAIYQNYQSQQEVNEQQYQNKLTDIDRNGAKERSSYLEEYFNKQITNFREFNSKISDELSKPTKTNALGFINLKGAKEQLKKLENAAKQTLNQISIEKIKVDQDFSNGLITKDAYSAINKQLNDVEKSVVNSLQAIKDNEKNIFSDWMNSVNQIVGQLGSALNSLVGALGDYTDTMYENRIKDLEKHIDEYEEKLDEQKEITQKYADDVNSIEEELSSSRGDRRQQLIDQLNAQLAAQRASLAQEKRMEKEKKRMEQEKEDLEKEKFEQQKKVQRAQAMMSGALAVTNALAVQPIWVGIATAAMVAAMTAVQIATINAQKYAEGGLIQGKSHAAGGVKVLGGQAEVEGGEFITNKVTTSKNVELLEYINSKKKRINLDDLIDFYGTPVRRNVQAVRTKFADGGIIPTLRNDITINDRLMTAFEDYSNRDVVVSVVDINDRQAAVNNVKVLAGLDA